MTRQETPNPIPESEQTLQKLQDQAGAAEGKLTAARAELTRATKEAESHTVIARLEKKVALQETLFDIARLKIDITKATLIENGKIQGGNVIGPEDIDEAKNEISRLEKNANIIRNELRQEQGLIRKLLAKDIKEGDYRVHTAQSGDTLDILVRTELQDTVGSATTELEVKRGVEFVKELNGLKGNKLKAGQRVAIPDGVEIAYNIETDYGKLPKAITEKLASEELETEDYTVYTVKTGDTYWGLVKKQLADKDFPPTPAEIRNGVALMQKINGKNLLAGGKIALLNGIDLALADEGKIQTAKPRKTPTLIEVAEEAGMKIEELKPVQRILINLRRNLQENGKVEVKMGEGKYVVQRIGNTIYLDSKSMQHGFEEAAEMIYANQILAEPGQEKFNLAFKKLPSNSGEDHAVAST